MKGGSQVDLWQGENIQHSRKVGENLVYLRNRKEASVAGGERA